jgi:hypothetical protein
MRLRPVEAEVAPTCSRSRRPDPSVENRLFLVATDATTQTRRDIQTNDTRQIGTRQTIISTVKLHSYTVLLNVILLSVILLNVVALLECLFLAIKHFSLVSNLGVRIKWLLHPGRLHFSPFLLAFKAG